MKPPKASIYIFSSCELVVNSSSFDEVRKMTESNTIQLSNGVQRDRSHRTHLLTTEAELGSTSPPLSPSHSSLLLRSPSYSSSPPRSPSWAKPRPLHSPWPPPSWAQPHPPHQLQDVDLEWIFVITNFVLEIPSAVFDQLSSARKPQYVLLGMLLSFAALVVCLVELIYTCQKQKVVWRWKGTLPWPWFYYRSRNRPFGNFKDIIGLVCALCQCIFAAIHYSFARRHADSPIKICFWPLVFAFGLLCSKVLAK
ncbi:TIR domain-containing protein [Citrus sinensis]|uniref:TIR domain-containing protein n=1 Tax=Citrus sinensis TaxID=2711 RepID=A0ACB8M6Q1_CITSI|nr:TIR domain-containing protein [Citrus sinensis]